MPRTVRYVLAKMKPGVSREEYERFEREVDYAVCNHIQSIVSYRTHRITEVGEKIAPVGWDYIERIEITDRVAYEKELAEKGKGLLDELYSKYLERSYTTSIWSELIEPCRAACCCSPTNRRHGWSRSPGWPRPPATTTSGSPTSASTARCTAASRWSPTTRRGSRLARA